MRQLEKAECGVMFLKPYFVRLRLFHFIGHKVENTELALK